MSEFFYKGARRGEILDAILYVLTHGEGPEGIIVLTGEAGSGVSTLCHSAIKRLPPQMQAIYIPQPPQDPGELFNAVARELALQTAGEVEGSEIEHDGSALAGLQKLLDHRYSTGVQTVLVFDEAQRMTTEMIEGIRVLYEFGSSQHKRLQIALAGQGELQRVLASPPLHDVKALITHWYRLEPLNPLQVTEYLISHARVSTGQRVTFHPRAIKAIGMVSRGIIDTLNKLADKSSSIAISECEREITEEHVRTAVGENGGQYKFNLRDWSKWHNRLHGNGSGAGFAVSLLTLGGLIWLAANIPSTEFSPVVASTMSEAGSHALPVPAAIVAAPPPVPAPSSASITPPRPEARPAVPAAAPTTTSRVEVAGGVTAGTSASAGDQAVQMGSHQREGTLNVGGVKLAGFKLLEQRVESTIQTMERVEGNKYTIQLFSTESIQPDRMERFLIRARSLVALSDLHVHIVKNGDKAKFRVTYGIYPSRAEATAALEELPEKYQSAFHPELFTFADLR